MAFVVPLKDATLEDFKWFNSANDDTWSMNADSDAAYKRASTALYDAVERVR